MDRTSLQLTPSVAFLTLAGAAAIGWVGRPAGLWLLQALVAAVLLGAVGRRLRQVEGNRVRLEAASLIEFAAVTAAAAAAGFAVVMIVQLQLEALIRVVPVEEIRRVERWLSSAYRDMDTHRSNLRSSIAPGLLLLSVLSYYLRMKLASAARGTLPLFFWGWAAFTALIAFSLLSDHQLVEREARLVARRRPDFERIAEHVSLARKKIAAASIVYSTLNALPPGSPPPPPGGAPVNGLAMTTERLRRLFDDGPGADQSLQQRHATLMDVARMTATVDAPPSWRSSPRRAPTALDRVAAYAADARVRAFFVDLEDGIDDLDRLERAEKETTGKLVPRLKQIVGGEVDESLLSSFCDGLMRRVLVSLDKPVPADVRDLASANQLRVDTSGRLPLRLELPDRMTLAVLARSAEDAQVSHQQFTIPTPIYFGGIVVVDSGPAPAPEAVAPGTSVGPWWQASATDLTGAALIGSQIGALSATAIHPATVPSPPFVK